MAIVAVKSVTTVHPTAISIMRVMLTAPSAVGDVSEIVGSDSEVIQNYLPGHRLQLLQKHEPG